MLFQPTNITPSSRGGLGNGTVDASQDLTVTWQVNGNSPLVAFSITIYQNNVSSTQLYTTGKITDGCPFYGVDYAGEVQFFSYTIQAATLSSASITNGGNYKLVIQQWWSENDSVTQSSAAAFITRATPSLTMNSITSPVAARSYTFGATYSQAQGDTLNWVRWMLAYDGQTDSPFYDSQNIYGTAQLSMTYDGLFRGNSYAVRCIVQTENGIEADTGWVTFSVEYSGSSLEGAVTATKSCGRSSVLLSWPAVQYVPAEVTGSYSVSGDGAIVLSSGNSVSWDTVNGSDMAFGKPWTVFWKTQLTQETSTLLTIGQSDGGDISVSYDLGTRTIRIVGDGTVFYSLSGMTPTAKIVMVLTESTLYLRIEEAYGGLYPSDSLYPALNLFPQPDNQFNLNWFHIDLTYTQESITSVELGSGQACSYIQIEMGTPDQSVIDSAYQSDTFVSSYGDNSYFAPIFANSLNGGNLTIDSDTIIGLAVYRREGASGMLRHLGDFPLSVYSMLDYGAKSQQGPYLYYLFPIGETTYISDPLESNAIAFCDWSWTLLACSERDGMEGEYAVEAEFRFDKNLSSGSMSNNNSPTLLENFTQYPTVQLSPSNYRSGTLRSLIGTIDYTTDNSYSDTISLRDAIYALSVSKQTLFLKNRKGDLFKVRLSGAVNMDTMDDTREQAQTVNLSWTEIGDASDANITVTTQDSLWNGGESA